MGLRMATGSSMAKQAIEITNRIIGHDVFKVMTEGSFEELSDTKFTQPACLLDGYVESVH